MMKSGREIKVFKIGLPDIYEVVMVYSRRQDKEIGEGIFNYNSESNALLFFTDGGTLQYTRDEVNELFELYKEDGDIIHIELECRA